MFRHQLLNSNINLNPLVGDHNIELFELIKSNLDKNKIQLLFTESCKKGQLLIIKWLWQLEQNINIHANDEFAFRLACEKGHLEVIKWLWQLDQNINIHVCDEYAFRWACANGHLEVIKWLWQSNQNINIHARDEYAF